MSIRLLESDDIIIKKIHSAYAKMLDQHLSSASGRVVSALRPIISSAISSSPEMQSVSGGILKADFGLTVDPVPNIAAAVADTINLQYNKIHPDIFYILL